MKSEFKQLPDEPIVIVTLHMGYDLKAELPVVMPIYLKFLDAVPTPVFWIVDARESSMTLDDLILGANLVARGQHPLYHHPNIRKVIYITTEKMLHLVATGMHTETFGRVDIKLFGDLDEALKFVRASAA